MDNKKEKLLIIKAQSGDREALGILWDDITPKLFGYLINATSDRTLAEDIFQSTWLKVINSLTDFQPKGVGLSAWIFAIARNECRQHWRKSKREISFDPSKHDQPTNDHSNLENKIMIDQVLSMLSENDREIIRLRYIADLSVNEVSRILNINYIAARVRIHRALVRARALIK